MAIIDKVRMAVGHTTKAYDDDLLDTIEAARCDMIASGVPESIVNDEGNRMVTAAIKKYARSEEAWETPEVAASEAKSYQSIVSKLALHKKGVAEV